MSWLLPYTHLLPQDWPGDQWYLACHWKWHTETDSQANLDRCRHTHTMDSVVNKAWKQTQDCVLWLWKRLHSSMYHVPMRPTWQSHSRFVQSVKDTPSITNKPVWHSLIMHICKWSQCLGFMPHFRLYMFTVESWPLVSQRQPIYGLHSWTVPLLIEFRAPRQHYVN